MKNKMNSGALPMTIDNDVEATKVVQFRSRALREIDIANIEDSIESSRTVKVDFVNDAVEFTLDQIVACMGSFGINIASTQHVRTESMVALEQLLTAIGLEYYRIDHPFQQIVTDCIKLTDDEPELESEEDGESTQ